MIVAGGFGTRLLPLTERRPKHLLEVGGVPFLEHQIARLAAAGVDHVVLATSYRADLFEPVLGDGSRWGIRLDYVQEQEPLGTAGAIRNVAGALGDDPEGAVVILNGDVLSGHDLAGPARGLRDARGTAAPVDVSLHLVEVDGRPRVRLRAHRRRPAGSPASPRSPSTRSPTRSTPAATSSAAGSSTRSRPAGSSRSSARPSRAWSRDGALVVGYVENGYWRDVGTPAALVAASRDLVLGDAPSPAVPAGRRGDALVDRGGARRRDRPGRRRLGGAPTTLVVGAGAVVDGSVLMRRRGRRATAAASSTRVLGPGAPAWARASRLEGVTVGDGAWSSRGPGRAGHPGRLRARGRRLP